MWNPRAQGIRSAPELHRELVELEQTLIERALQVERFEEVRAGQQAAREAVEQLALERHGLHFRELQHEHVNTALHSYSYCNRLLFGIV